MFESMSIIGNVHRNLAFRRRMLAKRSSRYYRTLLAGSLLAAGIPAMAEPVHSEPPVTYSVVMSKDDAVCTAAAKHLNGLPGDYVVHDPKVIDSGAFKYKYHLGDYNEDGKAEYLVIEEWLTGGGDYERDRLLIVDGGSDIKALTEYKSLGPSPKISLSNNGNFDIDRIKVEPHPGLEQLAPDYIVLLDDPPFAFFRANNRNALIIHGDDSSYQGLDALVPRLSFALVISIDKTYQRLDICYLKAALKQ